jgi:hypothetical protein
MLLRLDRRPGSRYLSAYPLAVLYRGVRPPGTAGAYYRRPAEMPTEERRFLEELGQDVDQDKPAMVIIRNSPPELGLPPNFMIHDYLLQAAWAQRHLKPYHEITGPKDYRILVRNR